MTMMAHYIAVLPSGVAVQDLLADWRSQVASHQECRMRHWTGPPQAMQSRPNKQLDWGAVAYEVTAEDLAVLLEDEAAPLPSLGTAERYAAIWVECY